MKLNCCKKTVLSVCDIAPNRFGSFEEFLVALTEKLNEIGFEHVIVFREKPIKNVEETLLSLGAKIKIIKPSRHSIYNFFKIYGLIKEVRPEIIHFHFYPVYTIVNYLKFLIKIKIIYTDHMGGRKTKTQLKKLLRRIYYHLNSKLFECGVDKIICVSNFVKSKYSKEYGIQSNKLCVIYNGINLNRFHKKSSTTIIKLKEKYNIRDEFVITCVGLRKDKGAHCLIKAAPTIIEEIPNVKFILVGEGDCRNYLKLLVDKLNISDYVVFTGNINDVENIYSISSCVVIPTLVEESFCFVATEAMATETPVIAFDSGAIQEVIHNKENIISINHNLLANKIIGCLEYNDSQKKEARQYVIENYSLDKCILNHVELYKDLS